MNYGHMRKRLLRTVADIVKAFGGTKKTAEWANTGMPTVSNWLANDEIPNGWHYRMFLELSGRGFEIDPAAFGVDRSYGRCRTDISQPARRAGAAR